MSRPLVPIAQLGRRIPEAGRLRFGVRARNARGKEYPKAIDTWRATSPDRDALEALAATYGGTVRPWEEPKADPNQFEVVTDARELRVVLPPDPLGGTPIYELWGGGGCDRRCDGVTAVRWRKGPDGPEEYEEGCVCAATGEIACAPRTRLSVILPDVRFTGTWRVDTGSWNAAHELPGMVELVQTVAETRGLTYAVLALDRRRDQKAGETRNYVVPVLGLPSTVEELAAGAGRVGALGAPATPVGALGVGEPAPSSPATPPSIDDEVAEAELLDDDDQADDDDIVEAELVEDAPEVSAASGASAGHGGAATPGPVCSRCGLPIGSEPCTKRGGVFSHKSCPAPGGPVGSTPPDGGSGGQAEDVPEPGETNTALAATTAQGSGVDPEGVPATSTATAAADTPKGTMVPSRQKRLGHLHAVCTKAFTDPALSAGENRARVDRHRHALCLALTKGRTWSSSQLGDDALDLAVAWCEDIAAGRAELVIDGEVPVLRSLAAAS